MYLNERIYELLKQVIIQQYGVDASDGLPRCACDVSHAKPGQHGAGDIVART